MWKARTQANTKHIIMWKQHNGVTNITMILINVFPSHSHFEANHNFTILSACSSFLLPSYRDSSFMTYPNSHLSHQKRDWINLRMRIFFFHFLRQVRDCEECELQNLNFVIIDPIFIYYEQAARTHENVDNDNERNGKKMKTKSKCESSKFIFKFKTISRMTFQMSC